MHWRNVNANPRQKRNARKKREEEDALEEESDAAEEDAWERHVRSVLKTNVLPRRMERENVSEDQEEDAEGSIWEENQKVSDQRESPEEYLETDFAGLSEEDWEICVTKHLIKRNAEKRKEKKSKKERRNSEKMHWMNANANPKPKNHVKKHQEEEDAEEEDWEDAEEDAWEEHAKSVLRRNVPLNLERTKRNVKEDQREDAEVFTTEEESLSSKKPNWSKRESPKSYLKNA